MMSKSRFALFAAIVIGIAFSVYAEPRRIKIHEKAGSGRDFVSLDGIRASGNTANLFVSVLKDDLENSGYFEVISSSGETMRVEGTAYGSGGNLNTRLNFIWNGGSLPWAEVSSTDYDARWQAHRFADKILNGVKGVTGMASTRIALIGKHDGTDVYYCDYDGRGARRLTKDRVPALSPYFHPNGDYIFYTSFIKKQANVYRVPVNGGERTPYAKFTGLNTGGAVSPNGKFLAVILSNPGNPELYVINMLTRRATRLTKTPKAAEASPCWSPDGNKIAYVSDESGRPSIHVIDSDTGMSRRISFSGSENVAPSWGPDGRITYCTKRDGSYQIAVCNPDGSNCTVVTAGADHEDPSWAPDGRHIVCSRKEGQKRYSICIIDTMSDAVNKVVRVLPLQPGDWHAPDWSRPLSR